MSGLLRGWPQRLAGLGEAMAQWIVAGTPPMDLSEIGIERFADRELPEDELRRALPRGVRQPLRGERRGRLDGPSGRRW